MSARKTKASWLQRFAMARQGSVATLVAVAMVPVVIAAGVGLDVSRAMSSRNNLQDALDATALALAHLPAGTAQTTLNSKATSWLNANLNDKGLGTITLTVTPTVGQLDLVATSTVKTTLTSITGYQTMPVQAKSTVKWGLGHVEIALVLDNTGSMAGAKLATLKTAANDLVDTLAASVDSSDATALKIAVVPFSMTVNVGSTYQTATWMLNNLPTAYGSDIFATAQTNRFTMLSQMGVSWGGCVEARPQPYDVQDTAPVSTNKATMIVPFFAPDEPDDDTIVSGSNWHGTTYYDFPNNYVPDETSSSNWQTRQGYLSKYDQTPSGGTTSSGYIKGPNAGCSLTPLQRLTTSTTTVKSKINAMSAVGDTNIAMGLAWGWFALSPSAPFSDGVAYSDANTKKILVLLTDGDNTMGDQSNPNDSNYNGEGYLWQGRLGISSGSASARGDKIDERMALICTNMKNAGVTVYTVRIDLSGTAPPALSGCASSTDKFYDVPDVADLSDAFANIAGSIGKLRLSN